MKPGKGVEFYGFPDGKARIFALPTNRRPSLPTPNIRSGCVNRPRA